MMPSIVSARALVGRCSSPRKGSGSLPRQMVMHRELSEAIVVSLWGILRGPRALPLSCRDFPVGHMAS